jgi:succinate dehydrogenase/fumarate reductase flavoprotein subunit
MNSEERKKQVAQISKDLERLQMEYATLFARRETLLAELRKVTQLRNRLKNFSSSTLHRAYGGGQVNINS